MHPIYYRHHFGLGRRLFWFGLGALGATWWHNHHTHYFCKRRDEFIKDRGEHALARHGPVSPHPPTRPQDGATSWNIDSLDQKRLRELKTQATDALADASEAILDSAFSTLEILRERLREQRVEKELLQTKSKNESEPKNPI